MDSGSQVMFARSLMTIQYICSSLLKREKITESGKAAETFKENERLHIEMKKLREENNLLKLKLEVLLDMTLTLQLSRTTAESQIQDRRSNESNYDKRDVT
ncbi:protein chibby homolog 1 isoform X4 [Orussus abietinus]|uniref:protein chibby homolog 1 isoform X4 n=1 Tax=Orussus abietinus TaxID=222816 RepID=UPI000C715CE5|nr:protein chibby homolog 1 isoform X4 [Orussus abietinus]